MLGTTAVQVLQRLADHLLQELGLQAQVQRPVFQPGDGEQVFHKLDEPERVVGNIHIKAPLLGFVQHAGILKEHPRVARNAGEGGAKVVGDGA